MREIIQFVTEGHALPSVTTDDASRLYSTAFLEQLVVPAADAPHDDFTATSPATLFAAPDPLTHHRAKQRLERTVAEVLKSVVSTSPPSAAAAGAQYESNDGILQQTQVFIAGTRVSNWADRVFRRMCATFVEAKGFVMDKESGVADAMVNRVGVADVYAVHSDVRQLAAANRKTVAQAVCRLLESAAGLGTESPRFGETATMLRDTVKLFLADGLESYRNIFETALLSHFDSVLNNAAAQRSSPPAPSASVGHERFRTYAVLAMSALHPSSVRPLLNLIGNDLFRTPAALCDALNTIGPEYLQQGSLECFAGLLIRHRNRDWSAALDQVLLAHFLATGGLHSDGIATSSSSAVDQIRISRIVDAAMVLAKSPGLVPLARVSMQLAVALGQCVDKLPTAMALGMYLDRAVKAGTMTACVPRLRPLIDGMRSKLDLDQLAEALERFSLRRALSFSGFADREAEEAHTQFAIGVVGAGRFARGRLMVTDAAESDAVAQLVKEAVPPPFPMRLRALAHIWLKDVAAATYIDVPLPACLARAWATVTGVYRSTHHRRRLHHVSNASRVTLGWKGSGATLVMPVIHFTVFDAFLDGNVAPSGVAVEIRDMCLKDLVAAGILELRDAAASSPSHKYATAEANLAKRRRGEISVSLGMHRAGSTAAAEAAVAVGGAVTGQQRMTPQHRRFLLEAAAMRLLKQAGSLPLADLFRRCLALTTLGFEPTAKEFRKSVESLQVKEYAVATPDDVVSYLA